ncbi:hypothetical protein FBU30_000886 [Linnemannia zychae]|nr:hypothetical protein FBU30_000886 [Linnemannia zychae]
MSERTCTDFQKMGQGSLVDKAKELTMMPDFQCHPCNSILDEYLPKLKNEPNVGKFRRLLVVERGKLNEPTVSLDTLPEELEIEDKVLDILIKLGEQMLEATKVVKKELSEEFGDVSDSGRKCDLVFRYADIEVLNIEFKRVDSSIRDLAVHSSKNVRLARCIQESHVGPRVAKPSVLMGDVAGYIGAFYQLRCMDDIAIAGTTTSSTAQLPRSRGAPLSFMQDKSLAMLFNYVLYLEKQEQEVIEAKEQWQLVQERNRFIRGRSSSADIESESTKPFENVVILTPTKKRKFTNLEDTMLIRHDRRDSSPSPAPRQLNEAFVLFLAPSQAPIILFSSASLCDVLKSKYRPLDLDVNIESKLNVEYRGPGYMTADISMRWLVTFDEQLNGRKIALLLDNAPGHGKEDF